MLFVFNIKQSEIDGLFNLEFLNSGFRDDAPSCSTHGSFALRFFAFLFDGVRRIVSGLFLFELCCLCYNFFLTKYYLKVMIGV